MLATRYWIICIHSNTVYGERNLFFRKAHTSILSVAFYNTNIQLWPHLKSFVGSVAWWELLFTFSWEVQSPTHADFEVPWGTEVPALQSGCHLLLSRAPSGRMVPLHILPLCCTPPGQGDHMNRVLLMPVFPLVWEISLPFRSCYTLAVSHCPTIGASTSQWSNM